MTPIEFEHELDRTLRGDQGAAQRLIDEAKALRAQLAQAHAAIEGLDAQIQAMKDERETQP